MRQVQRGLLQLTLLHISGSYILGSSAPTEIDAHDDVSPLHERNTSACNSLAFLPIPPILESD